MVTVSDRDGTITYASPATERVSGFTPEEFMARDPFDLMHPEDRPRYREALEKLSDSPGMSLDLEHRIRHKDGTWRWVEGTFKNLLDDPEVGGLVATVRDVTQRKRRESNTAFLVDLAEDLARPSSPDEIVRAAGERMKRHFGVSRLTFAVVDEAADEITAVYDGREQGLVGAMGTRRLSDYASEDYLREFKAGRPIAINGSNTDPRTAAHAQAYEPFRVRAQLMAPHVTDGHLDFVIAMQRPAPHEWRADEVGLLQELAERIYSRLERARAEETLRESEERYRALFDSIDEGFGIVEMLYDERGRAVDYRILETNPAFGRMTGFADAAGKTSLELNPDAEPYWFETLGRVAQTGEDVRFESYAEALDRWFDVYASRVGGQGSRRVAIVFANTTERKRAEEALRESEERLEAALHAGRMAAWDWDPAADRVTASDTIDELLGLMPGETFRSSAQGFRFVHPDDADRHRALVEAAAKRGESWHSEFRIVRPRDGAVAWLEERATAERDPHTGMVRMTGIVWDITERKRAEEDRERLRVRELSARAEAMERERISRELHDRVAHSMAVAHQALELHAALAESAPSRAAEKLELARETTRRALDQTRNLAAELKRMQEGELEGGMKAAFGALVETSVPDRVGVDLSFSGDESLVRKPVGVQVYLVMREAVRNAVKHSRCERIKIRLRMTDREVLGVVEDDGDGFDPDAVGKASPSWGVGLRSMMERAEMLGGELSISPRPERGTRVEVRVPLDGR